MQVVGAESCPRVDHFESGGRVARRFAQKSYRAHRSSASGRDELVVDDEGLHRLPARRHAKSSSNLLITDTNQTNN